ncbi:MAG: hypothetical protein Ct9H300mP1_29780 [Planctomycetaceae bacterium]|nr:MAG: hypothetical protein Ct9H300mP1_29780 [Planctomycetaceae bacterium]
MTWSRTSSPAVLHRRRRGAVDGTSIRPRPRIRQGRGEHIGQLFRLGDAAGFDAQRSGQCHEVDLGFHQVHPRLAVGGVGQPDAAGTTLRIGYWACWGSRR